MTTTPHGSQRVALVTGAGTGIGRASALALGREGFSLVLVGRRREPLEETAALLAGDTLVIDADVSVESEVVRVFEAVRERFGRLDVLFNNAGRGGPPVHFEDIEYDDWRQVVDVNLNGAFLCAREAFRLMKAQSPSGGRIVNNGSISAYAPRPDSAPYTATKHAISGLTRALALDGRRLGITCGQIDVGNAATEMTERMAAGIVQPDGSMRVEPRMDVEDVARAVVYMSTLPQEANVLFMTVMASNMPFVGRG